MQLLNIIIFAQAVLGLPTLVARQQACDAATFVPTCDADQHCLVQCSQGSVTQIHLGSTVTCADINMGRRSLDLYRRDGESCSTTGVTCDASTGAVTVCAGGFTASYGSVPSEACDRINQASSMASSIASSVSSSVESAMSGIAKTLDGLY